MRCSAPLTEVKRRKHARDCRFGKIAINLFELSASAFAAPYTA